MTKKKFSLNSIIDAVALRRWIIPLVLIIVYFIAFSILYPEVFLTSYNFSALMLEFSIPSFVIIGMAIQLINGEIDLSVGYVVMFSSILAGTLVVCGLPPAAAALLTIGFCLVMGIIVGVLVAVVGVNSFIATLGFGLIYYGFGLITFDYGFNQGVANANGVTLSQLSDDFKMISQGSAGGLQYPVFYAVICMVLFVILMSRTKFFRKYYYIGMNKEAAKLSGINVKFQKLFAFVLSAGLSSFAGVLLASRMGAAATTMGVGMELKAITAVVIGGISFKGGRGTMIGAVLGGMFIFCVSNGLRIASAPSNYYKVIEGLILLLAVIVDAQFSKRKVVG